MKLWEIAHFHSKKKKKMDSLNNFVIGFGFPRSLPRDHLPTCFDLASYILYLQRIKPSIAKKDIPQMVSTSLMSLWLEVGGSPIGMVGVVKKIKQLVTKVESFKRTPSWRRKSSKFPRTLFNITSCTCLRGKDWKKNLAVQRCEQVFARSRKMVIPITHQSLVKNRDFNHSPITISNGDWTNHQSPIRSHYITF